MRSQFCEMYRQQIVIRYELKLDHQLIQDSLPRTWAESLFLYNSDIVVHRAALLVEKYVQYMEANGSLKSVFELNPFLSKLSITNLIYQILYSSLKEHYLQN